MTQAALEICPDCGLGLPAHSGETHPYFGASPSCWALYGQVLAREYANPALMTVHRLTVDAYAAQHPGKPERRTIQSVWVHLAGLYLTLERGLSHEFARRVIGSLTRSAGALEWLDPPSDLGAVTVLHAYQANGPEAHRTVIRTWAESVWMAWGPHHRGVALIADRAVAQL